jgi:hypothetical protein
VPVQRESLRERLQAIPERVHDGIVRSGVHTGVYGGRHALTHMITRNGAASWPDGAIR